jgi:hypothetical protein
MVCAYVDSRGTSILKKQKKCRGKKPKRPKTREELADFEDLLKRCVRGSHTREPLVLTNRQRRDIGRLHREFRNNFIHFMPQGWSIEKAVVPRIIAAALDAAEALMRRDLCDASPGCGSAAEIAGEGDGRAGRREGRSALEH